MENTMENRPVPVQERLWFKYGWMSGGLAVLIALVIWVVDSSLMFNWWIGSIGVVIILGAGILAAIERKRQQGGVLTFAQGVTTSLLSFIVAIIISTIFNILLYTVIDPGMMDRMADFQYEMMQQRVDEGQMTEEEMEMAMRFSQNKGGAFFIFNAFLGILMFSAIALVIYLISSAIIRKEPQQ